MSTLELRVGNIFVDIVGVIPPSNWKDIRNALSFRPQNYVFSSAYAKWIHRDGKRVRLWDGWKRQIWKNTKRTYFPTGLFSIVQTYLSENKIPYKIVDLREVPTPNLNIQISDSLISRDYQIRVCNDACKRQRGIIQAATGAGKTAIAAGIIGTLKVKPFIFYVTSIDLLVQAKSELEKFLRVDGKEFTVGQVGGGVIDIQDINVATVQTVVRALGHKWDTKTKFDSDDSDDKTSVKENAPEICNLVSIAAGSISDEVQHWRADTCQLIVRKMDKCFYNFGMSATPYRDEGDDLMIQACFGKKISEISASELIQKEWLIKPNIKMVHIHDKPTHYKQWQSIYKNQVVENEYYNGVIANIANAYIKQNRLVLVLVQQINHGKELESLIPGSEFLSGSSPKQKRIKSLEKLRQRDVSCIISSTIFDEGIDVKPLDTLILAGQGKSKVRAMQRIGRILRPSEGKSKATAIDFCLHQKYLKDHAMARLKMYKTEPEFEIEEINKK